MPITVIFFVVISLLATLSDGHPSSVRADVSSACKPPAALSTDGKGMCVCPPTTTCRGSACAEGSAKSRSSVAPVSTHVQGYHANCRDCRCEQDSSLRCDAEAAIDSVRLHPSSTIQAAEPELFGIVTRPREKGLRNPCVRLDSGKLACMPYFFVLGVAKCASTALYEEIRVHPEFVPAVHPITNKDTKEIHWWDRDGYAGTFESNYLPFFSKVARVVQGDDEWVPAMPKAFTGDLSARFLHRIGPGPCHRSQPGTCFYDGGITSFFMAQRLHEAVPDAKLLVIMREPASRLWSEYLYTIERNPKISFEGHEQFHRNVMEVLHAMQSCIQTHGVSHCAFDNNGRFVKISAGKGQILSSLQTGMYQVLLSPYVQLFGMKSLHVIRTEDLKLDPAGTMAGVWDFLGVSQPTARPSVERSHSNEGALSKTVGAPWPETMELLRNFYRPFNYKLARLLCDPRFAWDTEEEAGERLVEE